MKTAESIAENIDNEFYKKNSYYLSNAMPIEFARIVAIEFAKLHCIEQARVISNACDNEIEKDFINSELILNAYSLDLIK